MFKRVVTTMLLNSGIQPGVRVPQGTEKHSGACRIEKEILFRDDSFCSPIIRVFANCTSTFSKLCINVCSGM
jgi:hypothetical protein